MKVFSFDLNQGVAGDISRKAVLGRILRLLASGQCRGILAAPPCTTYSTARNPPLRTWCRPRGRRDLAGRELQQVLAANTLVDHLGVILERAQLLGVPWLVENPASSLLWRERLFRRFGRLETVKIIKTHLCGFGCPWRKPTSLMCSRLAAPERLERTCTTCLPLKVCSFSGRPHIPLRGRDEAGMAWTRRAQAYSPQFSQQLARVFIDGAWFLEFQDRLQEMDRLWGPPRRISAALDSAG